jgi:aminopeptidase N
MLSLVAAAACGRRAAEPEAPPAPQPAAELKRPAIEWRDLSAVRPDHFSYANFDEVAVTHLALDLDVNFEERVLEGTATIDFVRNAPDAHLLILDTNDLALKSVEVRAAGEWRPAAYSLSLDDPQLGSALQVALVPDADAVRIAYRTSPQASGLQWLDREQTAGKTLPYMYSQNQSIQARSMAPVQDTPAIRMTYSATIRTPKELYAVMSAAQDPDGARDGDYRFDMPQPVPAYLLALAVGDIAFKPISDTIGVYGEPGILDAAAKEFADTPKMEAANVALYGPYRWGRYDMLVLPPSFPYGGMENPRLTFLTPTVIAGDKSLTNVVAHELAHSWSGNLVTNRDWRDGWLNEGVTSYVENRVIEELYGSERATMERALDLEALKRDIAEATKPELTQLKVPELADPDEAPSQVRYVKGMLFLKFLETRFGRAAFDPFLKAYFDQFAFQSITTEEFKAYLEANLIAQNPGAVSSGEIEEWLYRPGIPETAERPVSDAFDRVASEQAQWLAGQRSARQLSAGAWTTHEWLHFINGLPDGAAIERFAELDATFKLSDAKNAEIAAVWYLKAIRAGYEPALPQLEKFLIGVGRGKFIYRLYDALKENGRADLAKSIYATARRGYHPIAQERIDKILN